MRSTADWRAGLMLRPRRRHRIRREVSHTATRDKIAVKVAYAWRSGGELVQVLPTAATVNVGLGMRREAVGHTSRIAACMEQMKGTRSARADWTVIFAPPSIGTDDEGDRSLCGPRLILRHQSAPDAVALQRVPLHVLGEPLGCRGLILQQVRSQLGLPMREAVMRRWGRHRNGNCTLAVA